MGGSWLDDLSFSDFGKDDGDDAGAEGDDSDADLARATHRASLVEQAKLPGVRGQLAAELLVAHDERQKSVEASVLGKLGDDLVESGKVDWDDPETLDLIRASEVAREYRAALLSERLQRQALVDEGREPADIESEMAAQRVRAAAVAEFEKGRDPLLDSAVYQAYLQERREQFAALQLAHDELSAQSEADALEDARSGLTETYQQIAGG